MLPYAGFRPPGLAVFPGDVDPVEVRKQPTPFGRQAETISQYCTKGKPIFVEGRLKFDTWDDKHGQGRRSKLTVVVENFQFLGRAGDPDGSATGLPGSSGQGDRPGAPAPKPVAEQQKMFAGEDRKWRGGNKSAERPPRTFRNVSILPPAAPI